MSTSLNLETVEQTKSLMGDNFALIVECFLEDTTQYLIDLQTGIVESDIEKIKHASHTIKSSAKQLGADFLSEKARKIEHICIQALEETPPANYMDDIKSLLEESNSDFAEASDGLKSHL